MESDMTRRSSSVTIRDVAREAGVSVATISRYINRSARVSDDVAQRIEHAIDALHYVPHAAARHLATKKTRVIGLLLTNMHNDFFAPLVSGIEAVVREKGYNLLVATHRADAQVVTPFSVGAHNTDGLIVFADSLSDQYLVDLHRDGFPLILTHRTPPPEQQIPSVTVENKDASRRLVEHLITVHNRRRIMFARGPQHQDDSHWREVGYREALAENGLTYDPDLVICGDFEREIAYRAMLDFLSNDHPPFDAVFTGDDDSAIGIMKALNENGYRIPEDVSVVGFDDSRLSAFLTPPLTTVRAPTEDVGRTAAQLLFDVLSGEDVVPVTLLPTEIVIRHSCGC
jgi:DNA-binding LacI/PurR family transcriptional regulator